MEPADLDLLIDFHIPAERQGPGSDAETRRALDTLGIGTQPGMEIADIGCGTGAQTLVLAAHTGGRVTAVDLFPAFLEELQTRARRAGLSDQIATLACDMEALPFGDAHFDLVWSEGAIYNMGFAHGLRAWRRLLKPGGALAVSEITWLTDSRPPELEAYWTANYAEIDTIAHKTLVLVQAGYESIGHFVLPRHCWTEHYYRPMRERFAAFLDKHDHTPQARTLVEAEQQEIDLYEKYGDAYGYVFYLARRT
ncbi:MAG: class I SAM-dependent methyltransferase [Bacteroidia bacterium]